MTTSELSDALNPYVVQSRRISTTNYSDTLQPVVQPPQQYVPHRSELELAISEPPPPPPRSTLIRQRGHPSAEGVNAVQELVRIVAATRDAQEIERKRRHAWEQEQEAKYAQAHTVMESRMLELRQEITSLRSLIGANPSTMASGLLTPQYNVSPAVSERRPPQPASPISPVSQSPSYLRPAFIQGSSGGTLDHQPYYNEPMDDFQIRFQPPEMQSTDPPPHSMTPSPSPQLTFVQPSQLQPSEIPSPTTLRKKRHTSDISSNEDDNSDASDSSGSRQAHRVKRVNRHDKRSITIHHAMRSHILRLMELEGDKDLPDGHVEGTPLEPSDPVRFVWDKTPKQSMHNARMKAHIIADIKAKRKLYRRVSDKEFSKKALESAFDQSFTTFRQKYKAQRDAIAAVTLKKREDHKAQKARRISRRKIKLSNRADARVKLDAFEHVTFDGAMQIECMSSEESDFDPGPPSSTSGAGMLHTRGYLWRSTRLVRFYCTLDGEERADRGTKPKRGVGKKERCVGPPKSGFHLPPKGVATWMISRRWINTSLTAYPDLLDVLRQRVVDPPGFDWDQFEMLGVESESDDESPQTMSGLDMHTSQQHYTTSSLDHALY